MDTWKQSKFRGQLERFLLIAIPVLFVCWLIAGWWIAPHARIIRETERINAELQKAGIHGHAYYAGDYLWVARCGAVIDTIGDPEIPRLSSILSLWESPFPYVLWIKESTLTFAGLRFLENCPQVRMINLADCDVSDADVEQLRSLLPDSTISINPDRD
jgi:hypothetical protein